MKKILLCLFLLLFSFAAAESLTCDTKLNGCVGLPVTWSVEGGTPAVYTLYKINNTKPVVTEESSDPVFRYTPEEEGRYVLSCRLENGDLLVSGVVNVSKKLYIGTYEQDGKPGTVDALEWNVLTVDGDRALVITKDIIDVGSYFNPVWIKYKYTFWNGPNIGVESENWKWSLAESDSRLYHEPITHEHVPLNADETEWGTEDDLFYLHARCWCGSVFYEEAFTDIEKERILLTHNENKGNEFFNIDGGPDSDDYVFFLSYEEAEAYMPRGSAQSKCGFSYAALQKCESYDLRQNCYWWLRTPGRYRVNAMYMIGEMGKVYTLGDDVGHVLGYRPAMWIKVGD